MNKLVWMKSFGSGVDALICNVRTPANLENIWDSQDSLNSALYCIEVTTNDLYDGYSCVVSAGCIIASHAFLT